MHTLPYSYNAVVSNNVPELLHVSALTGPSSGRTQLYETVVRIYYCLQCVELSFKFLIYDELNLLVPEFGI
jgi:hypothetical protein